MKFPRLRISDYGPHGQGECNRNTTSVVFTSCLATLCNQSIAHLLPKHHLTLGIFTDATRHRVYELD